MGPTLVLRRIRKVQGGIEFGEDRGSGFGPDKGFGIGIVLGKVSIDGGLQGAT